MSIWHSGPQENVHLFLEKWNMTSYVNLHPVWTVPTVSYSETYYIHEFTTDTYYLHSRTESAVEILFVYFIKP